ncbi:MAG: hypothetical protein VXW60_04575 [Bacteroidota bacterium]|nr:hypothetical protein [Bacteroidota bacterium]MEC7616867.1 hypothetical protein [Bacteroidota bacterium]MEC8211916.1 hypothetical protein [Bacteroidota bacterium]MEE3019892.1 hypothetical protein [Bacteroidota bacterium]
MTKLLQILFACIVIAIITGFMLKSNNPISGDRVIGVTILFTTFIFMPLFIYHRWKDKKLADYTLTPENFKKMREMGKKSKQSK